MKTRSLTGPSLMFSVLAATSLMGGCAKSSSVSLQSSGYNVAASSLPLPLQKFLDLFIPSAMANPTNLTGIKLCITQMKLEAEGGSTIKNGDSDLFEARLGLVDLGNGLSSKTWGDLPIPDGTALKRLKVEIHKDESLCGVGYSAALTHSGGTSSLTKDIELKFSFSTARTLSTGDAITVGLTNFVSQLESARLAGKLNDEQVTSYLESYASGADDSAE